MPKRPDIYELLAAQQASDTTTTQLNSALKSTYIDKSNVEFWSGVITVAKALENSRTNSHGLPIPETGSTATVTIADGGNKPIKPTGTEVWLVQNIDFDSCTAAFTDGDGNYSIMDNGDPRKSSQFYLSSNLFITFFNGSGGEQTPSIAYYKVSL